MSEKKKVMMINVTHAEESRVAIVLDGVLEAFEIETFDRKAQKGNIYKGRVETVHPGLQAAFVDIGGVRGGFLPLDEVNFKLHAARKEGGRNRLENHLHKGQMLVQVVRDAYGAKPPTLSTYFSLAGRFLVLTPYADASGVSRKLDDEARDRLRKVLDGLAIPENFGVIARTAGASATKTDLSRDLKYLLKLWETIEEAARTVRPPKLIYQERSLVIRAIRDLFTADIDEILVDDEGTYNEICEFFDVVLPQKKKVVKLHQGDRPIFNKFNLEEQIENIFRRRIALPSGGAVVFDQTEALTAVDVNSGKMVQEGHIEDTALKTNVEAAQEISRQMRLRDLGGLVVIDFIDMRAQKNIRTVEKSMKDGLKKDKAKWDMTRISSLGLLEISRERLTAGKTSLRYVDCPYCEGSGSFKTVEAAAVQALRRLQTSVVRGNLENIEITLPPDVAEYLLNQKRQELGGWEERYHTQIVVKADPEYIRDRCEVRTVVRERPIEIAPMVAAPKHDEIMAEVEADEQREELEEREAAAKAAAGGAAPAPALAAVAEGGGRRKRRRRGGRKHRKNHDQAAVAAGNGAATAPMFVTSAEAAELATVPATDRFSIAQQAMFSDIFVEESPAVPTASAEVDAAGGPAPADDGSRKKRRRRRGGRKHRKNRDRQGVIGAGVASNGAGGVAASVSAAAAPHNGWDHLPLAAPNDNGGVYQAGSSAPASAPAAASSAPGQSAFGFAEDDGAASENEDQAPQPASAPAATDEVLAASIANALGRSPGAAGPRPLWWKHLIGIEE